MTAKPEADFGKYRLYYCRIMSIIETGGQTMQQNIYRRKLLNAVVYFCSKVRNINTTKLMKLLYYLDSVHFKQTGRPSIGLVYIAHQNGPLPEEFWKQVISKSLPEDLSDLVIISDQKRNIDKFDDSKQINERMFKVKRGIKPNMKVFTPREVEIMDNGIEIFGPYDADTASKATHELGTAWRITVDSSGLRSVIDYRTILKERSGVEVDEDEALENLLEYFSFMRNFDMRPV